MAQPAEDGYTMSPAEAASARGGVCPRCVQGSHVTCQLCCNGCNGCASDESGPLYLYYSRLTKKAPFRLRACHSPYTSNPLLRHEPSTDGTLLEERDGSRGCPSRV